MPTMVTTIRLTEPLRKALQERGAMCEVGRNLMLRYLDLLTHTRSKLNRAIPNKDKVHIVLAYENIRVDDAWQIRHIGKELNLHMPQPYMFLEQLGPAELHALVDALERFWTKKRAGEAVDPERFLD